jgi:hypothetical protein
VQSAESERSCSILVEESIDGVDRGAHARAPEGPSMRPVLAVCLSMFVPECASCASRCGDGEICDGQCEYDGGGGGGVGDQPGVGAW